MSCLKVPIPNFGDILLACHAALYRYARSLSRDPGVAEELVQETFRRALAASYKPAPATEENTRAWSFVILRNLWRNEVRLRNRWTASSALLDSLTTESEPLDLQVSRKLLRSEVRHAIDMLPESFREIVVLRDIEGMSYSEIAAVLGCPIGTVMSRLARARATLRRVLCGVAPRSREGANRE